MKKLFLLLTCAFLMTVLFACGSTTTSVSTIQTTNATTTEQVTTTMETTTTMTTTLSQLETPSSVTILDNVITFQTVDDANKYKLIVYNMDDEIIGQYNITSGFDLSLILAVGSYQFQLKATANGFLDSEPTTKTNFEISVLNQVSLLEGTEMNNLSYVRWLGRTYYNSEEELKYFYFTASGFELAFYGTELKVTFAASNYNDTAHQAYIVTLLDGEEDPTQGETIVLNQAEAEYTLYSGLEDGYHTVKVLKRSEAIDSDTAVKSISTDGYFVDPPQPKSFKIQYIAASSSTGFGNLGSLSVDKTSANSNGLLAYAYLSAFLLDAESSIFAASGWGVTRGWNTGGHISETQNIPNGFEYVAIDASNLVFTAAGKWDITEYIPDVIVVNLGTNDFNASGYTHMDEAEQEALVTRFKTDYTNFLILLNNMYPNAKIIVAYGLMNEQGMLEDFTLEIIADANASIGSTLVYAFEMEGAGTGGNPYGSSYHPNVQTSMNVAVALADFISTITGREVVRDMITYE